MKIGTFVTLSTMVLAASVPAQAQAIDDQAVCSGLVARNQTGLFAVVPTSENPIRVLPTGVRMKYASDVRFFFVPATVDRRTKELAWHARSQTTSAKERRANEVLVWRRPVERCTSPWFWQSSIFPQFSDADRFVAKRRYTRHHAERNTGNFLYDEGLGSFFHFELTTQTPRGKTCTRTDSDGMRAAFEFQETQNPEAPDGGLVSEILIADNDAERPCLRVQTPIPTQSVPGGFKALLILPFGRTLAANAMARDWNPQRTTFLIRQLPYGGGVSGLVIWQP